MRLLIGTPQPIVWGERITAFHPKPTLAQGINRQILSALAAVAPDRSGTTLAPGLRPLALLDALLARTLP